MGQVWKKQASTLAAAVVVLTGSFVLATGDPALALASDLFDPAVEYSLDGDAEGIAAGDLNGDGISDLAVADYNIDGAVSILLGRGDGTFATPVRYPAATPIAGGPVTLTLVDLNTDNHLDIVTANRASSIFVLLGNGDGTFGAFATYPTDTWSLFVAAGDFNLDGHPDIATANKYAATVSVLIGIGDGTLALPVNYSVRGDPGLAWSVAVGDLNSDGRPDLVAGTTRTVSIFLGNGDGTFAPQVEYFANYTYSGGAAPASVLIGDFNGDRQSDVAVVGASQVVIFLGLGDGTLQSPTGYSACSNSRYGTAQDINADGNLDVVLACGAATSGVNVLLGWGDGTLDEATIYATSFSTWSTAAADFDGDGYLDIAVAGSSDSGAEEASTVSVFINATVPAVQTIATNTRSAARNSRITTTIPDFGVPAGDILTISVATRDHGGTADCDDSKGNTYEVIADQATPDGRVFTCFAQLSTALSAGDRVTATYPGFAGISLASINAITSAATTGVVDGISVNSGNSTHPTTGTVVTTQARDVLFAAVTHRGSTSLTPDASFTIVGQVSAGVGNHRLTLTPQFRIASKAGDYQATDMLCRSQPWQALIVALKVSSS